jgi:histidinol phosphatase-like enzyme/predicted kinase
MSIWHDDNILNGVAKYCIDHGIALIAHRPLGGPRRHRRTRSDPVLVDLAARHAATPFEIALAWLRDLSPAIVAIPGPTRVETVHSVARTHAIALDEDDRARLDERFPAGRTLRMGTPAPRAATRADAEVVLIMGLPAAGKSTVAATFVSRGFTRLNRDEVGGSLGDLVPALDRAIASGNPRVVLDNTYVSRQSRARVIDAARSRNIGVRCLWLDTSIEDAQVNAVSRMLARYGKLLSPDEMRAAAKKDVDAFGPAVQFRYQRDLEPPSPAEGFTEIDVATFERVRDPSFTNPALIIWCDGVLSRSRSGRRVPASADDVEVIEDRAPRLRRYASDGWRLLGLSWQPKIAEDVLTAADVDAAFARTQDQLGVAIEVLYCPHPGGPPTCWCRKPLPGLGVVFIQRHRLDPTKCIYVGSGAQDPGFARRLGFQYREAADFFAGRGEGGSGVHHPTGPR